MNCLEMPRKTKKIQKSHKNIGKLCLFFLPLLLLCFVSQLAFFEKSFAQSAYIVQQDFAKKMPELKKKEDEALQSHEAEKNTLEPKYGGQIVFGSIGEPSNLIPYLSSDSASSEISAFLFISPLRYNKDLEIEPFAAKSYEILEEGRLFRFTLRDDIVWEDGKPLTADDVSFTYNLMIDPKTPTAYAENFLAISDFTQTGKYSFEVRYETAYARAISTWLQPILPKHILEGQDIVTTPFARKPIGAGPFRLKSWESASHLVLEASETYFEGRPYIDSLVYRIIPDTSTMFLELKAKKLDTMGLSPQQYLRQTQGKAWEENWRKYKYLAFAYTYLGYNHKHPFFKEKKVRQALSYAINREDIIAGALLGQGEATIGPYKPGTWAYNTALKPYPYEPKKAEALLKEAGFSRNEEGILSRDGKPFAFTILTNQGNSLRIKTATIIQSQLQEIGIKVEIRTVEWAAFIKEFVNTGQFDAIILGWTITQDPDAFDVWHSSKAFAGGLNFIGYKNTDVDSLLEKARATLDQEVRKAYYDKFQAILHEEQPYAFLYVPYALPIVKKDIQGIDPAPAGIMHNIERWWLK